MIRPFAARGIVIALVVAGVVLTVAYAVELNHDDAGPWFLVLAAALIAGAGASLVAFRNSDVGIENLADTSRRLAEGDLRARAAYLPGPLSGLTNDFNRMAGRFEAHYEEIRADQARIDAVFAAATDGLVALRHDTAVEYLNPAAETLFGERSEDVIGRPFIEVARDFELDALVRRALTGNVEPAVIIFGPRRLPLRAAAIPIESGGRWAMLLTLTDLTEVRRLDAVRRDFIGNVSHELRTPLASIRALVETIEAGYVDAEEMPQFTSRIHQQVDRLTLLVTELLDLSRIESGAIDLHPEQVVLGDAIAEAASGLQQRFEAASVELERAGEMELAIEADRRSVVHMVTNLLDNAIKFSPEGRAVRVCVEGQGRLAALSVTDQGPGIPPADLPRVFERFYTGDKSRAKGGVGLGLAIVKHLVRAHNGTVEATSPPGTGATFTIRLPVEFQGQRRFDAQASRRPEGAPLALNVKSR